MQVSYSNAYVDQLHHFFKKIGKDTTVYNFDQDSAVQFGGNTINYVKSKFPRVGIVNTLFELGKVHGISIVDYNGQKKKADGAVTNGKFLENTVKFIDRVETIMNSTKSNSCVAINLPSCYNAGWFAYQPNLFKEIANQNQYGLTYFRISDYGNNYEVAIDIDIDNYTYKEMMHKYQHTAELRICVTYKKEKNSTKFVFKEDE